MHHTSIYKEHYLGETYRTGVAYLRAHAPEEDTSSQKDRPGSIGRQRRLIAEAAKGSLTRFPGHLS